MSSNDRILANMVRTRKSLSEQLREQAKAQGLTLETTHDVERPHDPRLMWSLNGSAPLTAGQVAERLGVIWP